MVAEPALEGHVVAGRVLLVGDAAGYEDALTVEGMSLAVKQAASVAAIAADRPADYEKDWLVAGLPQPRRRTAVGRRCRRQRDGVGHLGRGTAGDCHRRVQSQRVGKGEGFGHVVDGPGRDT